MKNQNQFQINLKSIQNQFLWESDAPNQFLINVKSVWVRILVHHFRIDSHL